jgi:hypothetical protein
MVDIDTAAKLCVDTYWEDGSRTLDYAGVLGERRTKLGALLSASILVPAEGNKADPRKVRFFHDSMQSYLTALGLYHQARWDAFKGAAGRVDLRDQHAELFDMCLQVFHPETKIKLTLRGDLYLWAGSPALKRLSLDEIEKCVPPFVLAVLAAEVTNDTSPSALLRAAADECAKKTSLGVLADLYAKIAARMVEHGSEIGSALPAPADGDLARLTSTDRDHLIRVLALAYPTLTSLSALGRDAGVDLLNGKQSDRLGEAIADMIAQASLQAKLRELFNRVLSDPKKAAVHASIRSLDEEIQAAVVTAGALAPPAPPPLGNRGLP